jgi:hypothetical protein
MMKVKDEACSGMVKVKTREATPTLLRIVIGPQNTELIP